MRLKFFAFPALASEAAEAELHRFLASHRISQVERHCIAAGANTKGAGAPVGPDPKTRRLPAFFRARP